MAAPASAAPPPVGPGPGPTETHVGALTYLIEALTQTATLLQEAPAVVAAEAAGLMQEVPIVGIACKTFLSLQQLVETAKNNKSDLAVLLKLCDVMIKGLLDKRSDRRGLFKGFKELDECVTRANNIANLCNSTSKIKRAVLARKICKDIASVRDDLEAFCIVNDIVIDYDTNERVKKLQTDMAAQLTEMARLTVTQKDYEAMEKEVASVTKELETGKKSSLDLEANLHASKQALATMEAKLQAKVDSVSDKEEELVVAREKIGDMKTEVALKTKELETSIKTSRDLEAALFDSKEALTALKTELEEQRRVINMASKVKVPPGAPSIRDWYVERTAVVSKACDRLGIGSSTSDAVEEPRMVGLAGPSGAGKSTVASMVIARIDVLASFHKGVLWLQVGQGAKDHLPELMLRLAGMVFEIVMRRVCRPPRKSDLKGEPEDGAAYIREVVDESNRRFLVVADDCWDAEVLRELKRAGLWVLYTTRQYDLLPEPSLRLDQIPEEEAEMVLRRAAELDDDARLPEAAYELMRRCEFGVLFLAFIGRWGDVRGRRDAEAWQRTLRRIEDAQEAGADGKQLSWRAAVLRAGLEELAYDNSKNKELYLSLAVLPKGLAFPSEVAAVLLYGGDGFSAGDVEAANQVVKTLERLSILTLQDGGGYSVHDEHVDFVQGCFEAYQGVRERVLQRWRLYPSSIRALFTFSSDWLVKIWEVWAEWEGKDIPLSPYDEALEILDDLDISPTVRSHALAQLTHFHVLRGNQLGAYRTFSQLLNIENGKLADADTLHSLGVLAYRAEKPKEAEEVHQRALEIREEKLGVDHPDVASSLYDLGVCLSSSARPKEAEELYRRALEIRKKKLGVDHPDVARILCSLGVCVYETGNTEEAEKLYRRALAIQEKKLGDDDPHMAYTLHQLGLFLSNTGRGEEAERFFDVRWRLGRRSLASITRT